MVSRVSQVATEAIVGPTNQRSRVSQVAVEVLLVLGGGSFVGEPGGSVW